MSDRPKVYSELSEEWTDDQTVIEEAYLAVRITGTEVGKQSCLENNERRRQSS